MAEEELKDAFVKDDDDVETKDEQQEEQKEEQQEEQSTDEGSSIESASTVETEPTKEEETPTPDYVQLEQRVTSLEQRLLSVEGSGQPQDNGSDPNFEDQTSPTELESEADDSHIESTDDIKKLLDL